MLKERLYSEYQKRYAEYKEKHKEVEELQQNIENIREEGQIKKSKLEAQKKNELGKLSEQRKELERQLASVKKEGTNSTVLKDYSESKLKDIERIESGLRSLEQEKADELKSLQRKKKEAISELESDKDLCQRRLNDLMSGGDGSNFVKQFDEGQLRKKLAEDKEREITKLTNQYDASVSQTQASLEKIDSEYAGIMQRELSYIENDVNLYNLYSGLNAKAVNNELPQVITDVMSEPLSDVIQRNEINGGQRIAQIAYSVSSLDDLSKYTPEWLIKLVNIGFPSIAGVGLLAFFIFSGIHLAFVATATNAIASFLLWLVGAAIVGGIGYGIVEAKWGKGKVGGIIGAILGFCIVMHWSITLPHGVTNVVEWIVKVLICLAVGLGVYFLNTRTGVGSTFISIGMKIGFIKKEALVQQGYAIQANADSYYALIKYKEIIEQVVNENKQRKYVYLTNELERLEGEKAFAVDSLTKKIDRENEQTISNERASVEASREKYEQQQMNLIQMQDECILELSEYDGRIQKKIAEYDEKISNTTSSYDKKIADIKEKLKRLKSGVASDKNSLLAQLDKDITMCDSNKKEITEQYDQRIAKCVQDYELKIKTVKDDIERLNEGFAGDLSEIHRIFDNINNNTVGFDESQGVLSDYLYIYNENSLEDPKSIIKIKHDKKPIVFLYDLEDKTNISASLFEFMKAVLAGIYTINAKDAFDVIVTDPVSKARKFEQMTKFLTIENDIKKLSDSVQNSMRKVAKEGMHIDEHNRKMSADGEDKVKYFKYKIAEFIVPEEAAAQNTNFFDSDLWGTLGDGRENGFIPIFYISYDDWKNTFDDDSKLNSKFILQLKNAIGSTNGSVFKIDTEKITIENMN